MRRTLVGPDSEETVVVLPGGSARLKLSEVEQDIVAWKEQMIHLPADWQVWVEIDFSGSHVTPAQLARLYLPVRLEPLRLLPCDPPFPFFRWEWRSAVQQLVSNASVDTAPIGVCLPEDAAWDAEVEQRLNVQMEDLLERGIPFRIVAESRLVEEWHGLETLIVDEDHLSSEGVRRLKGFLAAGGEIAPMKN